MVQRKFPLIPVNGIQGSGNMLALVLSSLLILSTLQTPLASTPSTGKTSTKTYRNYLKTACNSTTYSKLCYKSLSPYVSTIKTDSLKLCDRALTVSLKAASNASSLVTSLSKQRGLSKSEAAAIKDCIYELDDSIDELNQSLQALGSLQGSDVEFQIDNIKTWVSAAITNEDTCTDGFEGRKVRAAIKKKIGKSIANVARLTSNALALINRLSY